MLNLFSFHRSFSWKLLTASSVPSHVFSPFLSSSQLFPADHKLFSWLLMSPELFSSLLISSRLISAFLRFSQLVSTLLSSPQLLSAHLVPSRLFSPPLTSSKLFSSPQLISDLVSSSHLISALLSALSNHITFSLAQNLLQKRTSTPKKATPTLCTEKISHNSKLSHRESFTRRIFRTQQNFYAHARTQQAFAQRIVCTQNLLHTEAFTHSRLLHTANFHTQQAFTQRIF